jgi:hypothetical protein
MMELSPAAESFPLRDALSPGIRGVEHKGCLILFRVSETEIRFTNAIHSARDLEALFRQPPSN